MRYEIRLSGSGGQGLILAGLILAEAAAIYDDKNATQSQSYGPEARGGASRSDVIISDEEIDYPKAISIDLLLALTQEASDKYTRDLKKGSIVIVDSGFVTSLPKGDFKLYTVPITDIATKEIGKALVANILALGLITGLSKVVTVGAMETAIRARVPKGTEELNMRAFKKGLEIAASQEALAKG
ncbi:MAG: 2-oxoacid:acceptor oxidoreductase family protein [candidate division KSB1 bacterium]|nr:2-oxoacid:acceptor oxidoreductase family protein [candidate division KSB1 bacterium]MDZ7300759.1 2-oxoacid:acceptor oxidoreductase family protein [candidate division KSB1 bacterium]MDZ7309971.1 2-oxoacid:acceptor oxidoreductase family protein [candidate division KSB1 bacterium]